MPEKRFLISPHAEQRRKFMSEAFHTLHQPLTTLHCGLELAILKERTPEDYRQRLTDALASASVIIQLSKVLRELAEAGDPGEDLRQVDLKSLLEQLGQELTYVAEAGLVVVRVNCPENISVGADQGKLTQVLGSAAEILLRSAVPGGVLTLSARHDDATVDINISLDGGQKEQGEKNNQLKLDEIRLDTACSYAWTLEGEFIATEKGFVFRLPVLE